MEVLRHCLPPSVRRTLYELPESLDETYERVLKEIKKPNREHARRLLQCLVVAIRPLRVEELAEVLAVDFDEEDGMPKLNPNWRWDDQEQALLSSCSNLIAIVESYRSRIVQFSHFSVKEYLTSDRLSSLRRDASHYHIDPEPAHTILAQACMSVLLRSDDRVEENGVTNSSPLARYAAEHWVAHAQDEKARSNLQKALEYLFDADKPYFAAWIKLHNIDRLPVSNRIFNRFQYTQFEKSVGTPLYYAALCGFQDLVEHLTVKYPTHVNARGGQYLTPLAAALAMNHPQTAMFLCDNGADPSARGYNETTPLHFAALTGGFETVRVLLKCKTDVNARDRSGRTPLFYASEGTDNQHPSIDSSLSNVARLLLEHGADINAQDSNHLTPLHEAARNGRAGVVHVLLEHVIAGLGAGDDDRKDTFPVVSEYVNARVNDGQTPLHYASSAEYNEDPNIALSLSNIARLLLKHGADVYARAKNFSTPLHLAAYNGRVEVVHVLLEHVSNLGAVDDDGKTAFQVVSEYVNARANDGQTPLHYASRGGYRRDPNFPTLLSNTARLLLEHGADVYARADNLSTPLHLAAYDGRVEVVRVLLDQVANLGAEDDDGKTVFQVVSEYVNSRNVEGKTPLHLASYTYSLNSLDSDAAFPRSIVARVLLKHGADINAQDTIDQSTPLHLAAKRGVVEVAHVLLVYGADIGLKDSQGRTAFQVNVRKVRDRHVTVRNLLSLHDTQ